MIHHADIFLGVSTRKLQLAANQWAERSRCGSYRAQKHCMKELIH
jgi:hypothetical protein